MTTTEPSAPRTVRPLQHLNWTRTAAGNIALVLPGAVTGIVLTVLGHDLIPAVVLTVIAAATVVLVILPALRIRLVLDRDGIRTVWIGHPGTKRVARDDVQRAVLRSVYNGDGVSTNQHLFLLGRDGRPVLRLSDRWWTHEQLLAVVQHLDLTLESQPHPVHLAELRRSSRSELRWSERHRVTAASTVVLVGFALCLVFATAVVHAA